VNYPWDTWPRLHTDDQWFRAISHNYADACRRDWTGSGSYMSGFDDGITNGWAWYEANGTRQDYMVYYRGGREVTIEVAQSQPAPEWELPAHWDAHRQAMLDYLEQALRGVRGLVQDADTGRPVAATVSVVGHDLDGSEVLTDPDVGDYHRMVEPGTYTLRFEAHAYELVDADGVEITPGAGEATRVDVAMELAAGAVRTVTGNIRRQLAGAPLPGARLEVLETGQGGVMTGDDGAYSTGPVLPGDLTFRVSRPGYQTLEVQRTVDAAHTAFDFVLEPDPTRSVGDVTGERSTAEAGGT